MGSIRVHPEVDAALRHGQPVVALETAVLTHGLPRTPRPAPAAIAALLGPDHGWRADAPANVELSRALARAVRRGGATPATVGVLDGELVIGLGDDEIDRLGRDERASKASERDLAPISAAGASAGTTVAATVAACGLASPPITVFATGGIGGVHRGWNERPDLSADLRALAAHRVCVTSAGAKSILDLPATVEALDTLGVPVLGFGTPHFPRFLSRGDATLPVREVPASAAAVAEILDRHWSPPPRGFDRRQGVLLCVDPPEDHALHPDEIEPIIAEEVERARLAGISADRVTPLLLAAIAARSGGRSVEANVAALLGNASVAASVAIALARIARPGHPAP